MVSCIAAIHFILKVFSRPRVLPDYVGSMISASTSYMGVALPPSDRGMGTRVDARQKALSVRLCKCMCVSL